MKTLNCIMKTAAITVFLFEFLFLGIGFAGKADTGPELSGRAAVVYQKAQIYLQRNETDKAGTVLHDLIQKHPNSDHYLIEYLLGNVLYGKGQTAEALGAYKKASLLYGGAYYVWQNMGKCHFTLENHTDAADCMKRAYDLQQKDKKNPSLLYHAAVAFILGEKSAKALPVLETLIETEGVKSKDEWLKALVKVSYDTRQLDRGIALFEKLIKADQSRAAFRRLAAKLYLAKGNYLSAAVMLKSLSYLAPLNDDETKLLGDLFAWQNIPSEAAGFYESVIDHGKGDPIIFEKLTSVYLTSGDYHKADDTITKAIQTKRTRKNQFLRGMIRYELKDYKNALKDFEACTHFCKSSGKDWLMLGYCAWNEGDITLAKKALMKANKYKGACRQAKCLLTHLNNKNE